jgi:hypothetical protein
LFADYYYPEWGAHTGRRKYRKKKKKEETVTDSKLGTLKRQQPALKSLNQQLARRNSTETETATDY